MNKNEFVSRNQLAGYFNLSQTDLLAILTHFGYLSPELEDGQVVYRLGFNDPAICTTERGVQKFSVSSLQASINSLPATTTKTTPADVPDEFLSLNQLSSLFSMGADVLRRRMRIVGLLKDSRNPSLAAPSSMYRMNDRTGFYQWNAKAVHAALAKAGQL